MDVKKILCFAFCIVFVLSAFVSCVDLNNECVNETNDTAETTDNTNTDSADVTDSTVVTGDFLDIVKDGVVVDIVYPQYATSDELQAANKIATVLKGISGISIMPKEVSVEYDPNKVEIVVGNTEYPESKNAFVGLNYCQGTVRVDGNKLIVAAYGEEAYSQLSSKLTIAFNNAKEKNKNVRIDKGYSVTVSSNSLVSKLPIVSGISLNDIKDAGDGCYILSFKKANNAIVEQYLYDLKTKGYSEYTSNTIEENYYYTYQNGSEVITVSFTNYDKDMKVMVESLSTTALPKLEAENVWMPVEGVSTTISQLGLYYDYNGKTAKDDYVNGMSYVIRLEDGSFIVIDGGHPKQIDSDRIYNVMKKQAPDPDNIVIAAWIFTHGHEDHTGFFPSFCQTYSSKVTVEQFIYNFPSPNELNDAASVSTRGNIERYFKDAEIVKAHPGQVFYIRNSKITMLYTNDLWDYKTTSLTSSNFASLVFTIEMEGKKIMMLGDYADAGTLRSLYSSKTLKSDIMQVSHHGISDCGTLLYPIVAPEWALWPLGSDYIEKYDRVVSEHQMNAYMKTMDKNKVFMAEDNIVILTLNDGTVYAQVFDTDTVYFAS